jgi:hypothetical protein
MAKNPTKWSDAGISATPSNGAALLLEDGTNLLLEDGSGHLLLEDTLIMQKESTVWVEL